MFDRCFTKKCQTPCMIMNVVSWQNAWQNASIGLVGWLVVLGFNATLTAKVISWQSVTHMFPCFLTPVLTQIFFPKPPNTFLACFCRGERQKYAGKKVASTGDRTHNHQVMSLTCSPLSHPGGANWFGHSVCISVQKDNKVECFKTSFYHVN